MVGDISKSPKTAQAAYNATAIDLLAGLIVRDDPSRLKYFGPNFFSPPLDAIMLGIIICQFIQYQSMQADDFWLTRLTAWYVVGMSVISTGLNWTWAYNIFVVGFGTFHAVLDTVFIYPFFLLFGFIIWVIQLHFSFKVYKLWERNWVLAGTCMLFSTASVVGGIGSAVSLAATDSLLIPGFRANDIKIFGLLTIYASVAADLCITGFIVTALLRIRTGFAKTDNIIHKLVLLVFESQAPPTGFALAVAIQWGPAQDLILSIPTSSWSVRVRRFHRDGRGLICLLSAAPCPLRQVGKLYAISYLFTLTSRKEFRGSTTHHSETRSDGERGDTFALSPRHTPSASRSDADKIQVQNGTVTEIGFLGRADPGAPAASATGTPYHPPQLPQLFGPSRSARAGACAPYITSPFVASPYPFDHSFDGPARGS